MVLCYGLIVTSTANIPHNMVYVMSTPEEWPDRKAAIIAKHPLWAVCQKYPVHRVRSPMPVPMR